MQEELQAGDRVGPYRLERLLGEGAVGLVFLAVHDPGGQAVALKVLKRELSANAAFEQRFLREARVAREVEHKHLVKVLESGRAGERCFLAVEFVDGLSLKEKIDAEGPLSLEATHRLASEIGGALDALHAGGLVHRDVKPSNIVLDATAAAFLTDFGLAKGPAYTVLTRPGQVMGTAAYLAPELIRGDEATPASDVYALGCVLYEAIAGRPPFASTNVVEILAGHLEGEVPGLSLVRPDVPPTLLTALLLALEKDPARRVTGTALARALGLAAAASRG